MSTDRSSSSRWLLPIWLSLLLSSCSDTYQNKYATYADAQASGAFRQGWVPKDIPASSYDLQEKHNIDVNWCYGSFRFPVADAEAWSAKIEVPTASGAETIPITPRKDWPHAIGRPVHAADLKRTGFELCVALPFSFAVDFQKGYAYYWRKAGGVSRAASSGPSSAPPVSAPPVSDLETRK